MARIIAALILVVLIALIVFAVSLLTKPSADNDKNSQNTQNSQDIGSGNQDTENEDLEDQDTQNEDTEIQDTEDQDTEDSDVEDEDKIYVKTTTQVKLRKEPNTECETLDRIDGDTKLEVLETLEGWYKVSYNGQTGYVSATYAKVVEE